MVCAEWSMYTDGTDFVLYSVDQLSPTGFHHSVLDRIQYLLLHTAINLELDGEKD